MTTADEARKRNRAAWNLERHEEWVRAYGPPAEAAKALVENPRHVLRRLWPHLGEVSGRTIGNLQGSHGRIATALALLGARVTVIDFAEENKRYAMALAAAAGTRIDYVVDDVMAAGEAFVGRFDLVVMELGILHYHQDIGAFFNLCARMLRPGGRLLLNEYHPVQRKLFSHLGTGDYFDAKVVQGDVPGRAPAYCAYRFWTLGEILSAVLAARLRLTAFEEHPDWDEPRRPGTFTLATQSSA